MVRLTEKIEAVEINVEEAGDLCRQRRPSAIRRHKRPTKVKKGTWKRGIHQRRNKRHGW